MFGGWWSLVGGWWHGEHRQSSRQLNTSTNRCRCRPSLDEIQLQGSISRVPVVPACRRCYNTKPAKYQASFVTPYPSARALPPPPPLFLAGNYGLARRFLVRLLHIIRAARIRIVVSRAADIKLLQRTTGLNFIEVMRIPERDAFPAG